MKFFEDYKKRLKQLVLSFYLKPKDDNALIDILRYYEQHNSMGLDGLKMMEGVLHIAKLQAGDVMLPKVQMNMVEYNAELTAITKAVVESGHSRFPVSGDSRDQVKGVLLAKDLLNYSANPDKAFYIKDIMRPAVFIPESKRLNILLSEFRSSRNHMAIVVDEFQNVSGLITIEDIIEEIIGDIADEHDDFDSEQNIKKYNAQRYAIKAFTTIDEFKNYFNLDITDKKHDTVGGLVVHAFGYLPKRGEVIDLEGFKVKVLRANKQHVQLLLFTR